MGSFIYMGPPGDGNIWKIYDGNLYIAFVPGALSGFFNDSTEDSIVLADERWKTWWGGNIEDRTGPTNTDCLGPMDAWGKHSCTYHPQEVR